MNDSQILITEAVIPIEVDALVEIDRRMFSACDVATQDFYSDARVRAFWVKCDGKPIGTIVIMHHASACQSFSGSIPHEAGSMLIVSTGLLPEFRRMGIGTKMKAWQMTYAREYKFKKVFSHIRAGNIASVALNMKFGFEVMNTIKSFYPDGEDCVVLRRRFLSY